MLMSDPERALQSLDGLEGPGAHAVTRTGRGLILLNSRLFDSCSLPVMWFRGTLRLYAANAGSPSGSPLLRSGS